MNCMCRRIVLAVGLIVILSSIAPHLPAAELTQEKFLELHQELQPGDEPWRTIPWNIDLLAAQKTAAEEHKPIFIWAMDGHPLGCT